MTTFCIILLLSRNSHPEEDTSIVEEPLKEDKMFTSFSDGLPKGMTRRSPGQTQSHSTRSLSSPPPSSPPPSTPPRGVSTPTKEEELLSSPDVSPVRRRVRAFRRLGTRNSNLQAEEESFNPPGKRRKLIQPIVKRKLPRSGPRRSMRWAPNVGKDDPEDENNLQSKWKFKCSEPSPAQIKVMIANVISECVKVIFNSHFYSFKGKFYRSRNKGPIGLKASGAIARIILIWWDLQFMQLLSTLGVIVFLYCRYVDDGNLAVKKIPKNVEYDKVSRQFIEVKEVKAGVEDDCHTFNQLKKVADTVVEMFKWEEEVASSSADNMLPILDLKVSYDAKNKRFVTSFIKSPWLGPSWLGLGQECRQI